MRAGRVIMGTLYCYKGRATGYNISSGRGVNENTVDCRLPCILDSSVITQVSTQVCVGIIHLSNVVHTYKQQETYTEHVHI
jgi:hypothetical protein